MRRENKYHRLDSGHFPREKMLSFPPNVDETARSKRGRSYFLISMGLVCGHFWPCFDHEHGWSKCGQPDSIGHVVTITASVRKNRSIIKYTMAHCELFYFSLGSLLAVGACSFMFSEQAGKQARHLRLLDVPVLNYCTKNYIVFNKHLLT